MPTQLLGQRRMPLANTGRHILGALGNHRFVIIRAGHSGRPASHPDISHLGAHPIQRLFAGTPPAPEPSDTVRDCGSRNVSGGVGDVDSDQSYIDKINQLTSQPSPPAQPASAPPANNLAAGATAMANGSQAMLAQAQSGGFSLDPHTGQALINALNTQLETLNGMGEHLLVISRQTKLGMTVGGQAMAKFNNEVATSGAKAFVPAHNQFVDTLKTMVQAIQIAMDNYSHTDTDNAQQLKAKD